MWFNTLPGLATLGAALLVLALLAAGALGYLIGRARRTPADSTNGSRRPSRKDERARLERATADYLRAVFAGEITPQPPVMVDTRFGRLPVAVPAPRRPQVPLSQIETVQLPRVIGEIRDVRTMGTTGTSHGHMSRRGSSRGVAGR